MNFIEYRLREILSLKSQKNFYFALLLSLKFMMLCGTLAVYFYMTQMSSGYDIDGTSTFIWAGTIITMFIFLGKEVISLHIKAFDWIDTQFRKFVDWYSLRYWKKHKKDAPVLSFIQKYTYKIFGFYYKLSPKRRKILLTAVIVCYGTYFIGIQYVNDLALWIDHVFPELDDI